MASLDQAREICTRLVERYENRELDEILVVYTDMKSSLSATVQVHRLLPLARGDIFRPGDEAAETPPDFEFIPSQEAVLNTVIYSYITGFIYSATVDSLCSEQNARVTAMDAAGRNADKLLSELSLQLNRERQAAITQEITEISAGAKALKRGRKEEENAAWQTQA